MKKLKKNQMSGITLIALVVTIIVLLLLAGISVQMLTGEYGILQRAGEAREITDKNQIVEQARLDILGEIAGKKGEDPTETKIIEILGTYFKEDTIPEDLSDLNQVMKTKSGGYTVKLSEVLDGVAIKQEIKETHIAKSTEKTESYVGYYADIDNDGDVDGIIYADMVVGNTKSGRWNNDTEGWSDYNITKIENTTTVKDYVVSTKIYEGQTIAGKYNYKPKEDAEGFGEKEVLVPATNSTGTKDRFYVMALEDFTNNSKNAFYWYYNAYSKQSLDRPVATTAIDFDEGKQKTIDMINDWNKNTTKYGEQTIASSGKNFIDLWGAIQDGQYNIVSTASDSKKWFIPSKSEWSAFVEELGITTSNYKNIGLYGWYWSSSQYDARSAYSVGFTGRYWYLRPLCGLHHPCPPERDFLIS